MIEVATTTNDEVRDCPVRPEQKESFLSLSLFENERCATASGGSEGRYMCELYRRRV